MIRAALLGMSTVVGVGAVLSYQPAAEVAGAAVAPLVEQPAGSAPTPAAPTPTAAAPSSTPEAGPGTTAAAPSPGGSSSSPKASASPDRSAGTGGTPASEPAPATTSRPSSTPSPVASTPRSTPKPSASSTPTRTPTPTPTPTPTDGGPRTWTGAAAVTPYGNVQVALVVDGGVIVDAYALQFPSEHPTSREIASYALPELRRQTLEAQSAAIAGVSGASYDTAGWITSLQSALSKAAL